MRIIDPNRLEETKPFAMTFRDMGSDIALIVNGREVSLRQTFDTIRGRHPYRFRGAIVYSEEAFRRNLRETWRIMSRYFDRFKVFWAVKAAPIKGLVQIAASEGVGIEVGSCEELLLARQCGVPGHDICHTGPGKFDWDIQAIVDHDCLSVSDNFTE
ncbi:MAG: hypothetical protein NTU41_07440, partial [Chloroflexi bacterium]|nr:hypothetical protein [Chloroflexota bacterium]